LYLPRLNALHGPLQFIQPLLNLIQSPNTLTTLSIFPSPVGFHPEALGLLNHPMCQQLLRLEIQFGNVASSRTAFDSITGLSLRRLHHLTITHGKHRFMFTIDALVRQSFNPFPSSYRSYPCRRLLCHGHCNSRH
jgi:hypothetical protein